MLAVLLMTSPCNASPAQTAVMGCMRVLTQLCAWTQAFLRTPPAPGGPPHVLFEHFWVEAGSQPLPEGPSQGFVVTPSIAAYLRSLARAILLKRYPILLQGELIQSAGDSLDFSTSPSPLIG